MFVRHEGKRSESRGGSLISWKHRSLYCDMLSWECFPSVTPGVLFSTSWWQYLSLLKYIADFISLMDNWLHAYCWSLARKSHTRCSDYERGVISAAAFTAMLAQQRQGNCKVQNLKDIDNSSMYNPTTPADMDIKQREWGTVTGLHGAVGAKPRTHPEMKCSAVWGSVRIHTPPTTILMVITASLAR